MNHRANRRNLLPSSHQQEPQLLTQPLMMNFDYSLEFEGLRDEFRMIRDEVLFNLMDRDFLNAKWGLNPTGIMCDSSGADLFTTSPSDQQATPNSTEFDNSVENQEQRQLDVRYEQPRSLVPIQNPFLREVPMDTDMVDSPPAEVAQRSRNGHKKSRQGCFNCKKRKIKCQETQPACENCTKKKLQCNYPTPRTLTALRRSAVYSPNPIASVNLQGTPTMFTLTDMRLFHHFLLEAYPHLPVGNESAWISQVPLIAQHNEYLMHAVLGMAASHLELVTGADLSAQAIHHRVLAIKGSNEAISRTQRTGSDGDALLASCYLLTFQSSYMIDGQQEFFQMVRGCSLLNIQLKKENLPMAFFLEEKDHFQIMQERLVGLPTINPELVESAKKSLAACTTILDSSICMQFYHVLMEIVESLKLSSLRAYFKFIIAYQCIIKMDNEDFKIFIDPTNPIAQVLIAQFLALQLIMAPIIEREYGLRRGATPIRYHLKWVDTGLNMVPERMKYLMEWPKSVAECVRDELVGKQAPVPRISILRKKEGLSQR